MKIVRLLNEFCKDGKHTQCPGSSKGTRSDPVSFICTCPCHTK